jgi:hypothetical protein
MERVRERKRKMVDASVKYHLDKYRESGTDLILGEGRLVGHRTLEVKTRGGNTRRLTADRLFLNPSTHAAIPDTPGLAASGPMTHIEALELDRVPGHLVIVGGGYVGLEFAQAMKRFGSQVTAIESGPQLLSREDLDIGEALLQLFHDEGIEVLLRAQVRSVSGVSGESVQVQIGHEGRERTIDATHILVAAGRTPNTRSIGFEDAGIELDERGYIKVNDRLETKEPGVWALGEWLMKLQTYGLMRDSFRLQQDMEYVRTIWRLRDRHVKDAGREVQHMQKALTKMNIQLANVISDISGLSGQAIVTAVLQGERDPYKLADLADYGVKASREEVARSLEGNWRAEVLFELQQAVDSYRFAHRQMQECDDKPTLYLVSLPTRILDIPVRSEGAPESVVQKRKKARRPRDNEPRMDMRVELRRICGVDLTSIDGVNVMTAFTVISEVGTDMSRFEDENHFASWMGLGPEQGYQQRKNCGTGQKESEEPSCRGAPHGSHLAVGERHTPGSPLSPSTQAITKLQGCGQSDGPLSRGADLPPADSWRSVGGPRVGAV